MENITASLIRLERELMLNFCIAILQIATLHQQGQYCGLIRTNTTCPDLSNSLPFTENLFRD